MAEQNLIAIVNDKFNLSNKKNKKRLILKIFIVLEGKHIKLKIIQNRP